ncbi:DUF6660 family protein [Chryseobacterium polytrichastri]|uniref:Uncharacterized protein n=1 Tax=Chryseobacterium polytrichastri TaxID=1302687 RepID=A0A1M7GH11_9FLAO|nr:DUF6660 family protein [Chryseobacterium polytrichastri]SHM15446.1 hypothetical protein SAMN05444267_103625 [Chryseobacterium polytrichastri]
MNLFRLILAMYFVVLSVMPCEDIRKQSGSDKTLLSLHIDESHSKDKGDICSPLCVCNCCQITVTAFKMDVSMNIPQKIQTYFSKKILFQKNNFAYQVYDHIWQPPKI